MNTRETTSHITMYYVEDMTNFRQSMIMNDDAPYSFKVPAQFSSSERISLVLKHRGRSIPRIVPVSMHLASRYNLLFSSKSRSE